MNKVWQKLIKKKKKGIGAAPTSVKVFMWHQINKSLSSYINAIQNVMAAPMNQESVFLAAWVTAPYTIRRKIFSSAKNVRKDALIAFSENIIKPPMSNLIYNQQTDGWLLEVIRIFQPISHLLQFAKTA